MKKYLLYIVILCTLCSYAHAQHLAYGLEAGGGASSMYFAPEAGFTNASQTPVISWKFGQVADVRLNDHIYFQTGAYISQKGQTRHYSFYTSDSLNASEDQTLSLLYADVPLNIVFKTGNPFKPRFFLGLGADFAYLIGGKNKYSKVGHLIDSTYAITATDRAQNDDPIKAFDLGLNINGGYELPSGLFFRLYYTIGITDVGLGTESDKNRIWGLSVGYMFGKAKAVRHESDELIDNSAPEDNDN